MWVFEVSHASEPERMLQEYAEAAYDMERNMMFATKGNKKKSKEIQEDVGMIKKRKNMMMT